MVDWMIEVCT